MAKNSIYKNLILNEDESLIKIIRQPWLKLVISLILPVILILLPFFFLYPLFYWGNKGIIIFASLLLIGLVRLIRNIIIWYWQIFIITNQRIVDIDQKGLFQKTVSDISLTKVQDVFYKIKGVWQTLTRLGDVNIILDDKKTRIEIKNIRQPRKIQQLILQLKAETLKDKLEVTQLSAQELINLVKKIKAGIGEDKFKEIVGEEKNQEIEES